MSLSVVIPAFNEEKNIGKTLKSVVQQSEKADEIIVVDNNSKDRTAEIAKSFGAIVIEAKKSGIANARNEGFNFSKSEIIARVDADTTVPPDWIKRIKEDLSDKNIDAVTGPCYYLNLPSFLQISHFPVIVFFNFLKLIYKQYMIFGLNMAVKRSAWNKVKDELCMDDKLVHEDFDLSIHLWKYGKIKFDSGLIVSSSPRKWKSLRADIEYTTRLIRMLRSHNLL